MPRISIVMPSFNHGRYIEHSLLSVLNQNYPNLELIVMDGGSTDGTRAILERYDNEICHWRSERDQGQSDALNKGFALASGEILGWLNSDDLYCPAAFEFAAQIFQSHPEVQVIYGDWFWVGLDNQVLRRYFALPYSRTQLITEGVFAMAQAMFWRKALHERFGQFDLRLHYTMDYEMLLRFATIAGRRGFYCTHQPLGCFRLNPGQKTGTLGPMVGDEHQLIAEKAGTLWKFGPAGRAVRLWYRSKRVWDYFVIGGPEYVMWKMGIGPNPIEGS
jgi:hypothetical protein